MGKLARKNFKRDFLKLLPYFTQKQWQPGYPLSVHHQRKRIPAGLGKLQLVKVEDNIGRSKLAIYRWADGDNAGDRLNLIQAVTIGQLDFEFMIAGFLYTETKAAGNCTAGMNDRELGRLDTVERTNYSEFGLIILRKIAKGENFCFHTFKLTARYSLKSHVHNHRLEFRNILSWRKIISMKVLSLSGIIVLLMATGSVFGQTPENDSTSSIEDKVFEPVEFEAEYPGGTTAWIRFLTNTVDAAVPANNNAPAGTYTVVIQFIVDKDSSITDFKALTNHGYGMEKEVIRALTLSGKWSPAIQNGKPIKAYRKQPVTFRVELDEMEIESETPGTLLLRKENLVRIKVNKVKDEDLQVTVSHGTVTKKGNGQYTVKLTRKDRVVIRVYNMKKNREEGASIFDVKE